MGAALIRATFGRDMQAAQDGRAPETLGSAPRTSMAGLARLGAMMPCPALTDVRHAGEVWLSAPNAFYALFGPRLNSAGRLP